MGKSVLVGMSGGIDSAMTVRLLKEEGYQVHGVHFNFYNDDQQLIDERTKVEKLAEKLEVDFTYYDARQLFREEVIAYFTSYYAKGLTPSPCVYCNAAVKLKLLNDLSLKWNYDFFATGHYLQLVRKADCVEVQKGKDAKKDQSYYMWMVPQNILNRFLTPLGDKNKADIKKYAVENHFGELVKKKESAGLCFAQGRGIAEMLKDYVPDLVKKVGEGVVYNRSHEPVGKHKGYIYYTLGQKSNMELTVDGKPAVVKIDHQNNALYVDHWNALYVSEFEIRQAQFYNEKEIGSIENIQTKVRGLGLNPDGATNIIPLGNSKYRVELENPAWAPAPGQPAVFYQDDLVLGGGIIV